MCMRLYLKRADLGISTGGNTCLTWTRVSCAGVQRDLKVQDIIDDMLQDLHLTDAPVLRQAGHQLLQAAVAVVHVAQHTERLVPRALTSPDPEILRVRVDVSPSHRQHGTDRLHSHLFPFSCSVANSEILSLCCLTAPVCAVLVYIVNGPGLRCGIKG